MPLHSRRERLRKSLELPNVPCVMSRDSGFATTISGDSQEISESGQAGVWWNAPDGKRVSVFPHCPRCASYTLYRKDNIGAYECLTCGLTEIEESTARRLV